jgi:hypothetical protein
MLSRFCENENLGLCTGPKVTIYGGYFFLKLGQYGYQKICLGA